MYLYEIRGSNRYLDVGDWGDKFAASVRHEDIRSTVCVGVHELVEKLLCDYRGISVGEVDADDRLILQGKKQLKHCRYFGPHLIATRIERILAKALELNWHDHERHVSNALERQAALGVWI